MTPSPASDARRIALLYALPALVWLIAIDLVIDALPLSDALSRDLAIGLILVFVLVSAGLLYWLLRRELGQLERARQALADTNAQLSDRELGLRLLFEQSPVGIALIRNVEVVFSNPAMARMFGYADLAGMRSKPLPEHFAPAGRALLIERMRRREAGLGESTPYEMTALRQDGSSFEIEIHSQRIELSNEPAILTFVTDITERVRAQATLRASDERLKSTLDAMLEGAQIIGFDWRYRYVNAAVAAQGKQSPAALLGHTMMEVYPGIETTELFAALTRCFEQRQAQRLENEFVYPDGSIGWFDLSIQPVPEGLFVLSHDISAQKRVEAELKQRLAELEAINRVSTALRTAKTVSELLPPLLAETVNVLHGSAGSVWLYDAASDELRLAHERGWGHQVGPFQRGEGIPGHVVATGQPYLSLDLKYDPRMPEPLRAIIPEGRGGACVPIRHGDQIIGVLYVNADAPRLFSADDLRLLTTLAELAGGAMHRLLLLEQTARRLNQLSGLRAIDQAISSSLDLNVTLEVILDQTTQQLQVDAAAVLLFDPVTARLTYAAGRGFRGQGIRKTRLALGEGTPGQAAWDRRLVRVADLRAIGAGFARSHLLAAEEFVSYAAMPLLSKGELKGVLEIFQRSPLGADSDWLAYLDALAGQAAIAIDSAQLFTGLQRSNIDLQLAYDATIAGWSRALDLRDKETEGHSQRVTELAERLAQSLGMSDAELLHLRRGALLHDIGKMGVPDGILLKPGPLTPDEWVSMRQHPTFAFEMLSPIHYLQPALDIPYCHHEQWDGSGYPHGLSGEQIPLAARIFAVVDVWDALRSARPYRPAWPAEAVRAYLHEQAGLHFDPAIVTAFLSLEGIDEQ